MASERAVEIAAGGLRLEGDLALPRDPSGLVVFAHGSGSSRRSPRNRQVAAALRARGLGTLLFDLLSEVEAEARGNVFDVDLLSERLIGASRWAAEDRETAGLALGYFGASTGAAAALCAAAELGDRIGAVVSRGGRPDLAGACLARVRAPTLLIVGGADRTVLALNEAAAQRLGCPHEIAVVPGATHLFEEAGALDQVVSLAGDWFAAHLGATGQPGVPA